MSKKIQHTVITDVAYVDLPPVVVSVANRRAESLPARVRIDLSLEVERKDMAVVEGYKPYITENVGATLSKIDPDQIEGPSNVSWLRSEMLHAVNTAGAPAVVHGVLFRRLLVM